MLVLFRSVVVLTGLVLDVWKYMPGSDLVSCVPLSAGLWAFSIKAKFRKFRLKFPENPDIVEFAESEAFNCD